ncbi:DNA-binding protein D-ETS-3-like isoform X1 [Penaeus monodon]|uniref:DNA-binding protein D-ETS-3-like isoform X1 n=1 Tax=Penaeus monodon TaxID=6687 RepID=UPI0018A7125C|nr:DNA-binding protein D-ETS-3-like isoform X1 [Penaeus monodon]
MSFDDDNLEPSLRSPGPLEMSGGDIETLQGIYLDGASATGQSSYAKHALHFTDKQELGEKCEGWGSSAHGLQEASTSCAESAGWRNIRGDRLQQESHAESSSFTGYQYDSLPFEESKEMGFDSAGASNIMENYGAHGGDIDESYEERAGGYTECDLQEPFSSLTVADEGAHGHYSASGMHFDSSTEEALFSRIPSNRNRDRRPKSWEFVMRLLASKQTNPALIRWEDESTGTFRLVHPKTIAKLWGTGFSGKPNLSYNNFARDLRHYYKSGEILPVREKQLVYKCGPEALAYLEGLQTT